MAENESLDLGQNAAWRLSALPLIRRGEDAAPACLKLLVRSLNKAHKQLRNYGVSVGDFLDAAAAGDHARLRTLVKTCEGHDYAQLLSRVAIAVEAPREAVLHGYIEAALDKYLDQMVNLLAGSPRWPQIPPLKAHVDEISSRLDTQISRLVGDLDDQPDVRLRVGRRAADIEAMLGVSLFDASPAKPATPSATEAMLGLSLRG